TGQRVFVAVRVTEPMRYIAVERERLRELLFEDSALSDVLLSAFVERRELMQQREDVGMQIVGYADSRYTRRLLDYARSLRLPYTLVDPAQGDGGARSVDPADMPLVRLPGGAQLPNPRKGELSRAD